MKINEKNLCMFAISPPVDQGIKQFSSLKKKKKKNKQNKTKFRF